MERNKIWYSWETFTGSFYCLVPQKSKEFIGLPPVKGQELADFLNKEELSEINYGAQLGIFYKSRWEEESDNSVPGIELPSGVYEYVCSSHPPFNMLHPITLRDDHFVKFEGVYDDVLGEFKAFLGNEKIYRDLGAIYKRGVLLYGPPGTGKTSIVRDILKNNLPSDSVVIFFTEIPGLDFLNKLSISLGNKTKVFVFEELINITSDPDNRQKFLEFLDGEKSLDKTFLFGTTNYPEKLPENIINRPSRWDKVIKVKGLSDVGISMLLAHFLKRDPVKDEIDSVRGLSTAEIKEICFMTHLHSWTFDDAVSHRRKHMELVKNEFSEKEKLGF